jgi:hypothetical protein
MFYPEAIRDLVFRKLAEVGAIPGIEATVRYEKVEVEQFCFR